MDYAAVAQAVSRFNKRLLDEPTLRRQMNKLKAHEPNVFNSRNKRGSLFYPFAEPAKHFLAVNAFAPVEAFNALQQLRFQFLKGPGRLRPACGLVVLETAETGADNFTGSLIKAALNFPFHKLCQFWRQRYIHDGNPIKFTSLHLTTNNRNESNSVIKVLADLRGFIERNRPIGRHLRTLKPGAPDAVAPSKLRQSRENNLRQRFGRP